MNFIDQITTYIIRPSREQYHINRLGPKQLYIPILQPPPSSSSGPSSTYPYISIFRDDYIITSHPTTQFPSRLLHYSYYTNHMSSDPSLCVMYLHANNGSRVQGLPYLQQLFKNGYNVCLIDFVGSGCSQGEYITLGLDQCQDLNMVVQDINRKKGVKKVVLWGRSMGACTGIIYAAKYGKNGSVVGMVLDSPFMDLRLLVKQTASQKTGLPQIFFQPILGLVNSELKQKIGHEFSQYNIAQYMSAPERYHGEPAIPILFLTSRQDKLVKSHHIQQLYNKYYGRQNIEKFIYYINNQHHEDRDYRTIGKCIGFIRYAVNSNHGKQINQNVFNKRNSIEIPKQNLISAPGNHANTISYSRQHNEDKKQPTSESTRYQPLATSDRGLTMQSEHNPPHPNDQKVSFSFRTQWLIKSSNNIPAPPLPTIPSSHQIGYHGGIELDSSYTVERMQQAKKDNFCLYKGKSIEKSDNRSNNSNIHSRVALNYANENQNADYPSKINVHQNSETKQRRGIKLVEKEKYKLSRKRKGQHNSYLSQYSQGQSLISNISSINLYHNPNLTNPHIKNSNFSQIPINKQTITNSVSHNYNKPGMLDAFPAANIGVNDPIRLSPKFKQSRINLSKIGSQNHSMQMHQSYAYPNINNTSIIANDRTRNSNRANNGYGDRYNSGDKNVNSEGLDMVKLIQSYKYDQYESSREGYSNAGVNINSMMKGINNQVGIQHNTKKVNLRQYSNQGRVQQIQERGDHRYALNGEKSPISKIVDNRKGNKQNGHFSLTSSVQKLYQPQNTMKYSSQQQQQQIQNVHSLKPQINRYSVQKLRNGAMEPNQQQQQLYSQQHATQFKYQHQSVNHNPIQTPANFNTHNYSTNKSIPDHPSSSNKSPQSHAPQKQTTKISLSKISLAQPNNSHEYYPPLTTTQATTSATNKHTPLGYLPMTGPIVPNAHTHTHTQMNGKIQNKQLYQHNGNQYAWVSKMG